MRLPRALVHALMLVAIGAGIWAGNQVFWFFAGG